MAIQIGAPPAESLLDNPLALLYGCHRRVTLFLKSMISVTQMAQGGILNPGQQNALKSALRYFREAAPLHTLDEEESLFPRLFKIQYQNKKTLLDILETLKQGHREVAEDHKKVDQWIQIWLTEGSLSTKTQACLSETLECLSGFYEAHIRIEEQDVFPIAEKMLASSEIMAIGQEMAIRRGLNPEELKQVTAILKQGSRST